MKINKKIVTKILFIITLFLIPLIFILLGSSFYTKISQININNNMKLIDEQSNNIVSILKNEIKDYSRILLNSEKFIIENDDIYSKEVLYALDDIEKNNDFSEIGILDKYGNIVSYGEKEKIFNYEKYFDDLKKNSQNEYIYEKQKYISNIFVDKVDSEEKIVILVPIKIGDKHEYSIYGKIKLESIIDEIDLSKESERYFQIVDDSGKYIYSSENEYALSDSGNIWDEIYKYNFSDGYTSDNLKNDIERRKSGDFHFEYNGEGRFVNYKPLGINNWYIFSMQTEEGLNSYTGDLWKETIKLLSEIIIILVILVLLIAFYIGKTRKTMQKKEEQISIQNKIFNLLLNRTESIPFEINPEKSELIAYLKNKDDVKIIKLKNLHPDYLLQYKIINEDGYDEYNDVYQQMMNFEEINSEIIELKIKGKYSWIKVSTSIVDKNDKDKHIVGILEDYNEQMEKEKKIKKHLEEISIMDLKTRTDYLTSIYNRKGFIKEMNYYLSLERINSMKDVFLILDLDNFKSVNDLLGHGKGDEVLIETANIMKDNLSKKDIVGRLAGDEFVVFIRDIEEEKDIETIAKRLNKLLNRKVEKNGITVEISASIGIAFVEKNDKRFEDLYEKADLALYGVKYNQKNGYKIYNEKDGRLKKDVF